MRNIYKIMSTSFLCCVGISLTGTVSYGEDSLDSLREENAKLKDENVKLKSENQRLKTTLNIKENGTMLASIQQKLPSQAVSGSEWPPTNTAPQPILPILPSQAAKRGWVLTQANEAKKWLDNNKLRSVQQNKDLTFEMLKKHPVIAQEIQKIKEDADKQPKELVEAVSKLFVEFNVDKKDEHVLIALIFPLLKEIYQSKSKDTDKEQVEKAAKVLWKLTDKKPDLFQLRRLRTLLQWES